MQHLLGLFFRMEIVEIPRFFSKALFLRKSMPTMFLDVHQKNSETVLSIVNSFQQSAVGLSVLWFRAKQYHGCWLVSPRQEDLGSFVGVVELQIRVSSNNHSYRKDVLCRSCQVTRAPKKVLPLSSLGEEFAGEWLHFSIEQKQM